IRVLGGIEDPMRRVSDEGRALAGVIDIIAAGSVAVTATALVKWFLDLSKAAKTTSATLKAFGGVLAPVVTIITGLASFSLGTYIYNEFKTVQKVLANVIWAFEVGWYGAIYLVQDAFYALQDVALSVLQTIAEYSEPVARKLLKVGGYLALLH